MWGNLKIVFFYTFFITLLLNMKQFQGTPIFLFGSIMIWIKLLTKHHVLWEN